MKKRKRVKRWKNRGFIVGLLRFIVLVFIGTIYFIYFIFKNLHTFIGKCFMNLPRITKVMTVYTLIFCAGFGLVIPYFTNDKVENAVIQTTKIFHIKKLEIETVKAKTKLRKSDIVCKKYSDIECKIFKKAKEHNLNNKQAFMLMAISKHETGNWSSSIFKNYYNMGGIIGSHGFRQYSSLDEGIEDFVTLLDKYYINNGRNTIELIGAKYCPVGASNDPTGLNNYWVPQVTKYYNEYVK